MNSAHLEQHIRSLQARRKAVVRTLKIVGVLSAVTLALLSVAAFVSGDRLASSLETFAMTLCLLVVVISILPSAVENKYLKATIESLQVVQRALAEDTHVEV